MPYIANTDADRTEMLERIGVASTEALFADIPPEFRFPRIEFPAPLSEPELMAEMKRLAGKNAGSGDYAWFLGAGAYNHFIPAAVSALASRGEFSTAYTPYQPEASQGTLQAIYEYQSMVAELTGMDAVNASHYDGATALAEAILMALRSGDENRLEVMLPVSLNPEYRATIDTYLAPTKARVLEWTGNPLEAAGYATEATACFVLQWPDFFGDLWQPSDSLAETLHGKGALFIVHADPIMLGIMKAPGSFGADIVTAEGQSLGNPVNFGGPYLGIMGTKGALVRRMPGRIVGEARDAQGRRGFALTLVAREQHIRREKAVSNICSNQGLAMLRACIYLALMGKGGLSSVASLCWNRAHYAAREIGRIPGYEILNRGEFFKEFTVRCPISAEEISSALFDEEIVPGYPVSRCDPERPNDLIVCVTELDSKPRIDWLAAALKEAGNGYVD